MKRFWPRRVYTSQQNIRALKPMLEVHHARVGTALRAVEEIAMMQFTPRAPGDVDVQLMSLNRSMVALVNSIERVKGIARLADARAMEALYGFPMRFLRAALSQLISIDEALPGRLSGNRIRIIDEFVDFMNAHLAAAPLLPPMSEVETGPVARIPSDGGN